MHTVTPKSPGGQSDTYMECVRRLPLKRIRTDAEHEQAAAMISELIGRELDPGTGDYLDALIVLVSQYEETHHAMTPGMTPRESLRALMRANQLTQADIGRIVGSESAVSMFLKGDRELSKSQIKKLSEQFKVEAGIFIE